MPIRMRCRFFITIDPHLKRVSDSDPHECEAETGESCASLMRLRGSLTTPSSSWISQQSQLISAQVCQSLPQLIFYFLLLPTSFLNEFIYLFETTTKYAK